MIPAKAIKKVKNEIHLEIAAGSLIAYGVFPQTSEGIQKAKETAASKDTWLAPSDLPEYYDGIDNDLITGNETEGIRAIRRHLKEFYGISSAGTETAEDTRVVEPEIKISDEPKTKSTKTANHPKLPSHLQRVHSRYMWGQHGVYDLEFESDIDKAIYHSLVSTKTDKEGYYSKETPQKTIDFREWLLQVTGLSATDIKDHAELKSYKKKILETIREIIVFEEGVVEVPPVYDGYYQDPDDEDEEDDEEEDDEEYDDLYGSNLDDLLNEVRVEESEEDDEDDEDNIPEDFDDLLDFVRQEDDVEEDEEDVIPENLDDLLDSVRIEEEPADNEKEVEAQADVATQVLVEAEDAREEAIDESVLDDLPDELKDTLVDFINKRTGKSVPKKDTKPSSGYVSNTKILRFLTNNIFKIQGQLDSINNSIQRQTELIQANLELTASIHENLNIQNDLLSRKLDAILFAIDGQRNQAKEFAEDQERQLAEQKLEAGTDVAGTETAISTLGKGKTGGSALLRKLVKFFGRKLASRIFKRLPFGLKRNIAKARQLKRLPSKLKSKLAERIRDKIAKKPAQVAVKNVTTRSAIKGFEHIALPGVSRAMKQADAPAAKAISKSDNFLVRALRSPAIQKGLIKVLGKEGAQKLSVKLAAKLIPGVSTAYGLGEGLARIAMGDVKGGFLSFGSAIPGAGYAFAAVDILRDIDTEAYTKHIESNLPLPSEQNFAAFFADALGVTEDQYETGGQTGSSQTVMLHGTELLLDSKKLKSADAQPVDPIGGSILAATTKFVNSLGPVGAPIAPMFEQIAAPLAKIYDVPSVLVQTNVGGGFPSLQSTISKVKEKKKESPEEGLSSLEKDLIQTKDSKSLADKLLKMIDPEGRFQQLLQNIITPSVPLIDGESLMAEGGYAVESADVGDKYGDRGGKHMGIDIASSKFTMGTPISVIKPGVVADVGRLDQGTGDPGGWGNFVVVKHDDGLHSLYGHLSQINVSKGQRLEPSSSGVFPVIGKIGSTGRSSGAHLHLEVGTGWTGGVLTGHMNPLPLVNQLLRGGGNVKKIDKPTGDVPKVKVEGLNQEQNKPQSKTPVVPTTQPKNDTPPQSTGIAPLKLEPTVKDTSPSTSITPQRITPPTERQQPQAKYYLRQGGDNKTDTKILMIPAAGVAGKAIEKNATIEGQRFTYNKNYNTFQTNEIPSTTRALLLRRLGLN